MFFNINIPASVQTIGFCKLNRRNAWENNVFLVIGEIITLTSLPDNQCVGQRATPLKHSPGAAPHLSVPDPPLHGRAWNARPSSSWSSPSSSVSFAPWLLDPLAFANSVSGRYGRSQVLSLARATLGRWRHCVELPKYHCHEHICVGGSTTLLSFSDLI